MAHAYSKLYNIPSTGLRFFTVYGPAGRPDMAYLDLLINYLLEIQFKFLIMEIVREILLMWMIL